MASKKARALVSEFLGSATLAMAVIGSGIMAQNLTEDRAVMLLINAIGTMLGLALAISIFSQIGVAHFNPLVSLWAFSRGKITFAETIQLILFQILGFVTGVGITNFSFGGDSFQQATQVRSGTGQLIGEVIASAGLIFVLTAVNRSDVRGGPQVWVPIWIGAAMLFTSSTSFANPALTFARSLTNSFTGISPDSVIGFVLVQLIGLVIGGLLVMYVYQMKFKKPKVS
jgi:glycerol uptake facilitator-like aquaporin